MFRRVAFTRLAIALTASIFSSGAVQNAATSESVAVQLLAFNDFHGHLEPPTGSNGHIGATPAGGIEYLATHLARLEAQNPNTLTVAAGDLIGASPLLSGLFHDEPTIEALNAVGLDVSSVGNHEFDEGWPELYRMQQGGCHPIDGCQDGTPFTGAAFQYLAANVILNPRTIDKAVLDRSGVTITDRRLLQPLFPASVVKVVGGVKVGFIGMTLRRTPELVGQKGVQGLLFRDEADSANQTVRLLRSQGVRTIVVLIHQGGVPTGDDYNGCDGVSEPIESIARQMSNDVDVIVSGHTHRAYICTFGGKLVTSAAAFGRLITAIDLRIDTTTGDVVSKTARNIVVTRDVEKSATQTAILDRYRPAYEALGHTFIGTIARDITRTQNAAGESALGDLVADSILEATRDRSAGGAVVAFMNEGGIRADLIHDSAIAGTPATVWYSEAFDVEPFQNRLVTKTFTGAMIREALEQQFDNPDPGRDQMLQVSAGFRYAYDRSQPKGHRVDPGSIRLGRVIVEPKKKYRVAMTDFTADGGDNFTVFPRGTDAVYDGSDLDALQAYFKRHSPAAPGPMDRIIRIK
jgi:5'-nucleotidase